MTKKTVATKKSNNGLMKNDPAAVRKAALEMVEELSGHPDWSPEISVLKKAVKFKVQKRNNVTWKLLLSHPSFQKDVKKIRQTTLGRTEELMGLIEKYKLPKNFLWIITRYVTDNEIDEKQIPDSNYEFSFPPLGTWGQGTNMPRATEIHLITFAQLDNDERKIAFEELSWFQKHTFPKSNNFLVTKKTLGTVVADLETEKLASARSRKKRVDSDLYLENLKRQLASGALSQKGYQRAQNEYLKVNSNLVTESYTSAEVSGVLDAHGIKKTQESVRKSLQRLNKERENRFGV